MSRTLRTLALAATACAVVAATPGIAGRDRFSRLDDEGKPIGGQWSATDHFSSLTAVDRDDVRLTTGSTWRIKASGDPRALSQLRFLVEKDSLIVGRESGHRDAFGKARIEITTPALRAVTTAGSGAVDVDRLTGDKVSATIAGSGSADVHQIAARRVDATIAGSGMLTMAGRSEAAHITVAGSGDLDGRALSAGAANVTVAGSGEARLRASGAVRATIVGSGNVSVTGTLACKQTRVGSGRLRCTR